MIESVELIIKQSGHADRVVRLPDGATRLGRAEDNEVVLSDAGVSRRHAQVYVSRGEVTVEDLGSGNGTYYNGYRVQSQPIQDGDEIVIDPFVLGFRIRGGAAAAPPGRPEPGRTPSMSGGGTPARLEVVVGTGMAGSSYPITSRGLSVGRSEDRDVVIPDPAASRHHCQITVQGGEYVLRDMGSANGIFVNAVRVRECTLADGDMIRIGNTEMRFVRYEQGAADHTTQVVQGDPGPQARWNEPALPPPSASRPPEPAPRRRSSRPLLAVVFGGLLAFVAMLAVLVLVLVIVFLVIQTRPVGPTVFPAQPPRWQLKLPPNLEAAPVDKLFDEGRAKMQKSKWRDALQDFFRVLQADPAYPGVDKFAFAAGEYMVLAALEEEFKARTAEKQSREAERDRLMRDLDGKGAVRLRADQRLKSQFRDDPVVMERLGLPPPEEAVKVQALAADAMEKLAANRFDEAVLLYAEVLSRSNDPAVRKQALAQLKLTQLRVAQASADAWSKAVLTEAAGDRAEAKKQFTALKQAHPANPSPPVHLARLP